MMAGLLRPETDRMTPQERFEALAKDKFLGVPVEAFEAAGREQLRYLVRAGLNPSSKLVDLGCGVLRAGYWKRQTKPRFRCKSGLKKGLKVLALTGALPCCWVIPDTS